MCFLDTSQLPTAPWFYSEALMSTAVNDNNILTLANWVLETSDAINELSVLVQVCLEEEALTGEHLFWKQKISYILSDQSLLVPVVTVVCKPTCTCASHTQKLWKWQVSSRFPRNRICLMGRSSCWDTVVKATGPKPLIHRYWAYSWRN